MDMRSSGENGDKGVSFKIIWNISVKDNKKWRFFREEGDRGRRSRRIEDVFGIEGCRRVNWSGLSER